jgi:hypothetical protein
LNPKELNQKDKEKSNDSNSDDDYQRTRSIDEVSFDYLSFFFEIIFI